MKVSGQHHEPPALPPAKEPPGIHWIGDWVGRRALSESYGEEENLTPAVIRTPAVQPVARLYTDWAISTP
jgi:hypothetical protein